MQPRLELLRTRWERSPRILNCANAACATCHRDRTTLKQFQATPSWVEGSRMSSLREKPPFWRSSSSGSGGPDHQGWVTATMETHESSRSFTVCSGITTSANRERLGFLAGHHDARLVFFVAVTLLAIGLILYFLFKAGLSRLLESALVGPFRCVGKLSIGCVSEGCEFSGI